MTPTIYIDFKNPASYLALGPTCALLDRLNLQASWRPFATNEETIPARKAEETRGEQHRRVRALARRQTHLLYAGVQGIEMHFRDDPGETNTSLAALALLEDSPLPYIRAAFERYWVQGDNLNDEATVRALWNDTVTGIKLDLAAGRKQLDRIQQEAIERRVFHAPGYWLGEHLFMGREHLPWIERILLESESD